MRLAVCFALLASASAAPSQLVFHAKDNTRCTLNNAGQKLDSSCDVSFSGHSIEGNARRVAALEAVVASHQQENTRLRALQQDENAKLRALITSLTAQLASELSTKVNQLKAEYEAADDALAAAVAQVKKMEGPKGERGADGADGINGTDGAKGEKGEKGESATLYPTPAPTPAPTPGFMCSGKVTLDVKQGHMHSPSHHTGSGMQVKFFVNGAWTTKTLFSGSSQSNLRPATFDLAAYPTKLMLYNPTGDGWSYGRMTITSGTVSETLSYGDKWLHPPANTYPTYDIDQSLCQWRPPPPPNTCSGKITLDVKQGTTHAPSHHTGSGMDVQFRVNGRWVTKTLFQGSSQSNLRPVTFDLAAFPTEMKLYNPTGDGWSYGNVDISTGSVKVRVSSGDKWLHPPDNTYPTYSIDQSQCRPLAPTPPTPAPKCSGTVTLDVRQGHTHSPSHHTASGIDVDFLVNGNWVQQVLFSGSSQSNLRQRTFHLQAYPTEMKLVNPTGDGWSYSDITLTSGSITRVISTGDKWLHPPASTFPTYNIPAC